MTDRHEMDRGHGGDEIDAAIDRAVRSMMEGDADPSFRARLMARLEHSHPRAHLGRWAAAAAAAAAAGLALTLVLRPEPPSTRPRDTVRHAPSPSTPSPTESTPTRPAPTESAPLGRLVERSPEPSAPGRSRGRAIQAASLPTAVDAGPDPGTGRLTAVVEPMEAIPPIAVGPLELGAIAPASITVASLAPIGELQIQQLLTPIGRD